MLLFYDMWTRRLNETDWLQLRCTGQKAAASATSGNERVALAMRGICNPKRQYYCLLGLPIPILL